MIRKQFFLILMSLFLYSFSVCANPVILRSIRVENTMHKMRVIYYLSASTQYRSFMLTHPNRFVIDLKNVTTDHQLIIPTQNTPISDFKYATHRDGIFRMVFGLKSRSTPLVRVLSPDQFHQARLTIIFNNPSQPQPLASLASPQQKKHSSFLVNNVFLPHENDVNSQRPERVVLSDNEDGSQQHRDIIVVVDPGHGGKDPGATGPGGTHEKTIVLSISKKLQKWIDAQPGYHALLTRSGDYYLTLRQRLRIARKDKADMFVAIHADTWRNTTAGGVSVFALSQKGATSEAARWLAARENASELMGGVDLQDKSHLLKSVLINLSQVATIRASLEIGNDLLNMIRPIARLHHDRVEQAAFVVLKSPDIPSLLVETGFLSNPNEERKLRSQRYQNKLARAIMQGICAYFSTHPPRGTWLSYWKKHPNMQRSLP